MLQGSARDEEGFDLVHLCSVFASDPFVMAFAKLVESGMKAAHTQAHALEHVLPLQGSCDAFKSSD